MLAKELPPLKLESDVSPQFSGWKIDEAIVQIMPSPDVQEQLNKTYNQILSRTYVNEAGQRIMLMVAYGEDQADRTTVAHLPDGCYPAQGFAISPGPSAPVSIQSKPFPVRRLVARRNPRVEPITYWTVVGNEAFQSDRDRRIARLRSSLAGIIPDGMLVRVSSIDPVEPRAFALHDTFISDLYSSLSSSVRPRIFGTLA
jgi:EpsI family protein